MKSFFIQAALLLFAVQAAVGSDLLRARRDVANPFSRIEEIQSRLKEWYMDKFNVTDDEDRVIGGVDAKPGEAPFQAQLHIRSWTGGLSFTCGGSLINSRTILSAAHCVNFMNDYRIRYGSNSRLSSTFPLGEVQEIKMHPKFNLDTITHDIALFILRNPVQPGSNVAAVNLQTSPVSAGSSVTLFGFGLMNGNNQNSLAQNLQKAQLDVVSERECLQFFSQLRMTKTPGHLCVSARNRGSCNGDSGGPLLVSSSGNQIGVVSFGLQNCPPGAIDVFTHVPYYMDWIRANVVGDLNDPGQDNQEPDPNPPVEEPVTSKPTTKRPSRPATVFPPNCRWTCDSN